MKPLLTGSAKGMIVGQFRLAHLPTIRVRRTAWLKQSFSQAARLALVQPDPFVSFIAP
jgi:hypothetical protein